ncbi:MAG: hypothetical protein OHK0032_18770 [Thermodesulfovibrionales bacterium]
MAKRFVKQSADELFYLDDDELDAIRAMLVYMLMKNTPLDREDIYTYIFGGGKRILWN